MHLYRKRLSFKLANGEALYVETCIFQMYPVIEDITDGIMTFEMYNLYNNFLSYSWEKKVFQIP